MREHPDQWRGVSGLWELIEQARAAGELDLPREDMLFFATPHEREVSVNSTRVSGVLGTDVFDLTRAEHLARHQMDQIMRFLRKRVPGFDEAYVVQSGTHIGVRETRRIVGEYQLTADDVLRSRHFDDVIARGSYPIDIHDPKGGRGTLLERLPTGGAYDIPLRCLIPRNIDGLLVGGRCISGTHEAHSSYRVTPISARDRPSRRRRRRARGAIRASRRVTSHPATSSERSSNRARTSETRWQRPGAASRCHDHRQQAPVLGHDVPRRLHRRSRWRHVLAR